MAQQDPRPAAVAGHALDRGRGKRKRELHLSRRCTRQALQGLDCGGDMQVGRLAAVRELDQSVRVALLEPAIVGDARPARQRLERSPHRRATNWVKDSVYEQTTVLSRAQGQPAVLHQL